MSRYCPVMANSPIKFHIRGVSGKHLVPGAYPRYNVGATAKTEISRLNRGSERIPDRKVAGVDIKGGSSSRRSFVIGDKSTVQLLYIKVSKDCLLPSLHHSRCDIGFNRLKAHFDYQISDLLDANRFRAVRSQGVVVDKVMDNPGTFV